MPGPSTEVLNEDVKELQGELRDIRSNLEVLKADVHRIDIGLAELRAEFRFAKWLLGLLLMTTLTGVAGGIWTTSRIVAKVDGIEARFDRLESPAARGRDQASTAPAPLRSRPPSPPGP